MPASAFTRRSSNAQSSFDVTSSVSSSPPNVPPVAQAQHIVGPSLNNARSPSSIASTSTPVYALATVNAPASDGYEVSEFGSVGISAAGVRLGRRGKDGSSTTTSPSLSPSMAGNQSTFPSGPSTAEMLSLTQSLQASNMDMPNLHSASNSTFTNSTTSAFVGSSIGGGQHTGSSLQETFARRIRCLSYLKRCLSISSTPPTSLPSTALNSTAWLDVIRLSKRDVDYLYESEKMKKRANRNYILGCSLAPILDYNSSAEFARAVLAVFLDAESIGEGGERDKTKMKNFFKSSIRVTRRGGGADWESGLGSVGMSAAGSGSVDLLGGHVPFTLDFFQTTVTLFDILVEMYHKINMFLTNGKEVSNMNSSIGKDADTSFDGSYTSVSSSTLDTMNKIDVKVKKILSQTCKEIDALARQVIREELASIDPIMARELGVLDGNASHPTLETAMQQSID